MLHKERLSPATSCLYMEHDIHGMECFIQPGCNVGAVPSVPTSYKFAPATGWLKKSVVSVTTAKILMSL